MNHIIAIVALLITLSTLGCGDNKSVRGTVSGEDRPLGELQIYRRQIDNGVTRNEYILIVAGKPHPQIEWDYRREEVRLKDYQAGSSHVANLMNDHVYWYRIGDSYIEDITSLISPLEIKTLSQEFVNTPGLDEFVKAVARPERPVRE